MQAHAHTHIYIYICIHKHAHMDTKKRTSWLHVPHVRFRVRVLFQPDATEMNEQMTEYDLKNQRKPIHSTLLSGLFQVVAVLIHDEWCVARFSSSAFLFLLIDWLLFCVAVGVAVE